MKTQWIPLAEISSQTGPSGKLDPCESDTTSPCNDNLATDLMAKAWNSATQIQNVTTVGATKSAAQKWDHNLLVF